MTPNSMKPLYLINKISGYIKEHNGYKYLTLVHTDESEIALKTFHLIRSINNTSNNYNECMGKLNLIQNCVTW